MIEFGPFARVFEKGELRVPGHLILLGLRERRSSRPELDERSMVFRRVLAAVEHPEADAFILALFADLNWRPHLVAAIAALLKPSDQVCAALWRAIDGGSWVTPQLAAAAYFLDPDLPANIRGRVGTFDAPRPPVRTSSGERRSAKLVTSLMALADRVPVLDDWRRQRLQGKEFRDILASEADKFAGLTLGWLERCREVFAKEGRPLSPRFLEA